MERDFDEMAANLEDFLFYRYLNNKENCQKTIKKFSDVHENCNELFFDLNEEVAAYNIFHFLTRYYRFQKIYLTLINKGLLPIRKLPSDLLEVGLGPGQGSYALSDLYFLLKEYGLETQNKRLNNLEFVFNYVEKSKGFRDWLHLFGECLYERKGRQTGIPYHSGSYVTFEFLKFKPIEKKYVNGFSDEDEESQYFSNSLYGEDRSSDFLNKYNMIVFSNFFTQVEQIPKMKETIRSCCYALRNGGIFVVIGATGEHYKKIYSSISNEVCAARFMRKIFSENQKIEKNEFIDRRFKKYYSNVYKTFDKFGLSQDIPEEFMQGYFNLEVFDQPRWKLLVFRKQLKHRKRNS